MKTECGICGVRIAGMALCLAAALSTASAHAQVKKFIYCGWDLGRATTEELAESADLFRDTAADGVAVYANFKDEQGVFHKWSAPFSGEPYPRKVLDRLVPAARAFAEKSGLRENFVHTSCAPKKRMGWTDDAAWRQGIENFASLARFAKMAGAKGLIVDFEDYPRSRQFIRAADDPDFDTCAKLARRRGAEVFGAAFREFPEAKMLAYYWYTSEMRYVGEPDPYASMKANGDLYPSFLNGALDVIPETAQFIDGNEIGYRLEAERGDFWRFAEQQHVGILPLVAPELREKYRLKVGTSFGHYVDSYIFEEKGRHAEYYKGPLNGSRLARFRANLAQSAEASDEYLWMWNEYHPYVKWRRNERCADLMAKGTLEEVLPGATRTMLSVRSPSKYIDRYCTERDNLAKKLKDAFWQTEASKKGGGEIRRADFGGRKDCFVFKGVSSGCVFWTLGDVKSGEAFAFAAKWKGDGVPFGRCAWKQNGFWIYSVAPARMHWGEPDADGWRQGEGIAVVPPGVDWALFEMSAAQRAGESSAYDAGSVKIVKVEDSLRVSSLGWREDDSTEFLQAALDSGVGTVIVDKAKGPWVTRPLFARSNQTIVFEKGVELVAKKGEFMDVNDCLFTCMGVSNVVIRGNGAKFRMHQADYYAAPYKKGEWRHTLKITGSSNVTVEGLALASSGGDGVYIGTNAGRGIPASPSTDIVLRDLVCDRNHRQGISVISARRLLIERCALKNTSGNPPAAGIDFEPNLVSEELTDIVMRDCEIYGNQGNGMELCFMQLDGTSRPVSITIENCRIRGNYRSVAASSWNRPTFPPGFVRFRNCTFADARDYAVYVQRKPLSAYTLIFENCEFANAHTAAKDASSVTDIGILPRYWNDDATDGIRFENCTVRQPVAREWMTTMEPTLVGRPVSAVEGSVTVVSPDGSRKVTLDKAWRDSHFKPVAEGGMPEYKPFVAATARTWGAGRPLSKTMTRLVPMNVRNNASYRFYVPAAGRVCIAGRQHLLGRKKPTVGNMAICDGAGKEVASYPVFGEAETEIAFDAPAPGFYRLQIKVPANAVQLCAANVPIALEMSEDPVNMISSAGALRFCKERGERAVLAFCGDIPERFRVVVRDPDGNVAWDRDRIGEWTAFTAAADAKSGFWTLEIKPPTAARFEDCNILVRGILPELFLADNRWGQSLRNN